MLITTAKYLREFCARFLVWLLVLARSLLLMEDYLLQANSSPWGALPGLLHTHSAGWRPAGLPPLDCSLTGCDPIGLGAIPEMESIDLDALVSATFCSTGTFSRVFHSVSSLVGALHGRWRVKPYWLPLGVRGLDLYIASTRTGGRVLQVLGSQAVCEQYAPELTQRAFAGPSVCIASSGAAKLLLTCSGHHEMLPQVATAVANALRNVVRHHPVPIAGTHGCRLQVVRANNPTWECTVSKPHSCGNALLLRDWGSAARRIDRDILVALEHEAAGSQQTLAQLVNCWMQSVLAYQDYGMKLPWHIAASHLPDNSDMPLPMCARDGCKVKGSSVEVAVACTLRGGSGLSLRAAALYELTRLAKAHGIDVCAARRGSGIGNAIYPRLGLGAAVNLHANVVNANACNSSYVYPNALVRLIGMCSALNVYAPAEVYGGRGAYLQKVSVDQAHTRHMSTMLDALSPGLPLEQVDDCMTAAAALVGYVRSKVEPSYGHWLRWEMSLPLHMLGDMQNMLVHRGWLKDAVELEIFGLIPNYEGVLSQLLTACEKLCVYIARECCAMMQAPAALVVLRNSLAAAVHALWAGNWATPRGMTCSESVFDRRTSRTRGYLSMAVDAANLPLRGMAHRHATTLVQRGDPCAIVKVVHACITSILGWTPPGPVQGSSMSERSSLAAACYARLLLACTLQAMFSRLGGQWVHEGVPRTGNLAIWGRISGLRLGQEVRLGGEVRAEVVCSSYAWGIACVLAEAAPWWLGQAVQQGRLRPEPNFTEVDSWLSLAGSYLQPWQEFSEVPPTGIHASAKLAVALVAHLPAVEQLIGAVTGQRATVLASLGKLLQDHAIAQLPVASLLSLHSGSHAAGCRVQRLPAKPAIASKLAFEVVGVASRGAGTHCAPANSTVWEKLARQVLELPQACGVSLGDAVTPSAPTLLLQGHSCSPICATDVCEPALAASEDEDGYEDAASLHHHSSLRAIADGEQFSSKLASTLLEDIRDLYSTTSWRAPRGTTAVPLCCALITCQHYINGKSLGIDSLLDEVVHPTMDLLRVVAPTSGLAARHLRQLLATHLPRLYAVADDALPFRLL